MKNYEKPIVLTNEDLAEGVYAASGAVSGGGVAGGSGTVAVSSVETDSVGNQWYKVNVYKVTITNFGSESSADWSVSISVTSGSAVSVSTYGDYVNVSLSGKKITISAGANANIGAGQSIECYVVVNYDSDSITVQ